jgi:intraflagellar transport protein 140
MINQEPGVDNVNSLFFFGGSSGSVCLADDLKNCSEVCKVPGSVKSILFHEKENSVIIITSHLLLVQFKLNLAEKLVPDRKVKLAVAGNPEYLNTIWAGQGLMATVSGENMIRMFNIESDENYILSLAESAFQGLLFQDKIITLTYNKRKRMLTGGTKNGYVVMWKCKQLSAESPSSAEGWEAQPPIQAKQQSITSLAMGGSSLMSAVYANGVTILNHTVLKKKMKDNFKMIQISNKAVEVRVKNDQSSNSDFQIIMTLGMNIKGIDCCGSHTLFWNGKFAQLYDVQGTKGPQLLGNFESNSSVCALTGDDSIVQCQDKELQVCSYFGEVKQVLPLTEQEGDVIKIDARGKFMAVVTSKSMIKIFDISRRQYKQLGITRRFEIKSGELIGEIKDIALNADGKKLALLSDQVLFGSNRIPDRKFYIYDIDMDSFMQFEVSKNRVPVEAFWDQTDARLLAIETEYGKVGSGSDLNNGEEAKGQTPIGQIKDAEIEDDFRRGKDEEF